MQVAIPTRPKNIIGFSIHLDWIDKWYAQWRDSAEYYPSVSPAQLQSDPNATRLIIIYTPNGFKN